MYKFYSDCVGWPHSDVPALSAMIEAARGITRRTFLKHVDRAELRDMEKGLGYERGGLMMASDWAVSYHRSTLHGKRCYYFRHSAIEHVFTNNGGAA